MDTKHSFDNTVIETPMQRFDKVIVSADRIMRALWGVPSVGARRSPSSTLKAAANQGAAPHETNSQALTETQRRESQGLMRVNHTGELCAQALYEGQALTSRSKEIKKHLRAAAQEEQDHLSWCAERLHELGGRPSLLNPAFYAASFVLGSGIGLLDAKIGLGFVSATEDEVCDHLDAHLQRLPEKDVRSRAVLEKMREEEAQHGTNALRAGGVEFPESAKKLMRLSSKVMTETTYHI